MKQKTAIIGIILLVVLILSNCTRQTDFPVLKGPYLGQRPPGNKPEVFAPGIISHGFHEHALTISPDGKEMFFVMTDAGYSLYRINYIKNENDKWSIPQFASFSSDYHDLSPSFVPDGRRLYFGSSRPTMNQKKLNGISRIWYVEKSANSWGTPHYVNIPVDSSGDIANPSISANGTLFYQYRYADKSWDIFFSRLNDGKYSSPENLGNRINTPHNESAPFIAPDESYILFHSNRPGGYGSMDIYVSYRLKDNSWSEPKNLGNNINSSAADWKPTLSPERRYLFFSSYKSNNSEKYISKSYKELIELYRSPINGYGTLFWVDAKIIEDLKPVELR